MPSAADLAQLRMCEHAHHEQIDEKGIGIDGAHLTTCPDHPTYNREFAEEWKRNRARWMTGRAADSYRATAT